MPLTSRARTLFKILDTLILRLRCLPQNDSLLLTLQYTLQLLHSQLLRLLTARYERLAISIASKASETMLPGEALVATIEAPHLTLTNHCAGVNAARETVQDIRMGLRLAGLLKVYGEARELGRMGRRDPSVKVLEWGKLFAQGAFLGCENLSFLAKRGVLRGERWEKRGETLYTWSWRIWGVNMFLEALRLYRVKQMRFDEDLGAQSQKEEGAVGVRSKDLEEKWYRDLYSTLGWVPATVIYSGWYGDGADITPGMEACIGLGGMLSGGVAMKEAWKATA